MFPAQTPREIPHITSIAHSSQPNSQSCELPINTPLPSISLFFIPTTYPYHLMYITSNSTIIPQTDIKVVGKVTKIDSPFIFLQYNGSTVKIKYNNLHKYTKNTLVVTGTYSDGVLEEKYVDELDDEFDEKLFYRVVGAMEKYNDVF